MSKSKNRPADRTIEDRVVAFAEQVGWVVGVTKAKTEGWLDQAQWTDQLTRIRDGASELLDYLQGSQEAPPMAAHRSGSTPAHANDMVHAPGKKHRAPLPTQRGVKHSDQQIARAKQASMRKRTGNR